MIMSSAGIREEIPGVKHDFEAGRISRAGFGVRQDFARKFTELGRIWSQAGRQKKFQELDRRLS
jgi:hypothetical protein